MGPHGPGDTCRPAEAWNEEPEVFIGAHSLASQHLRPFIYERKLMIAFLQGGHAH